MSTINITNELWDFIATKEGVKRWEPLARFMAYDLLSSIQLDGERYWIETDIYTELPNNVYYLIREWGKKRGFKYLYEI